ncbi:aminodeoxychorismate synthase component I [Antrihabitans sp. YC2-6]|uniref:aminodeoxychorismate synthase component I n=1 Tax=Antrihabitans sp. YC2-6 TaxID=2799498 RepID=UPI0018F37555|nr:aminodeoxychorismate synthase component I [Antrihabitans sp. YC2-6]MBJ8343162.1 aminodeoxychorismate synthase component I [Antrihabitans sp. YC2-6]
MVTRTLLIDNYDSFTYNLFGLLTEVNGTAPTVVANDSDWELLRLSEFDNIVVSPGPGRPDRERDFGISRRAILESNLPVLGVCLGHQGLCNLFGSPVVLAPEPRHGRISQIHHSGTGLFDGIPSPFDAIRYHSLIVEDVPADMVATAWTADGLVMGVAHRTRPLWGVQFHPESICTEFGRELLDNFRKLTPTRSSHVPHATLPRAAPVPQSKLDIAVRRIDRSIDAHAVYERLFAAAKHSFWLDGSSGRERRSRFSVLGDSSGPRAEFVTYTVAETTVRVHRAGQAVEEHRATLFDYLERQLARRTVPKLSGVPFAFGLGYVGFLGYELKADAGGQLVHTNADADASMVFADRAVVIDHEDGCAYLLCLRDPLGDTEAELWLDSTTAILQRLEEPDRAPVTPAPIVGIDDPTDLKLRHDYDRYIDLIAQSLEEIRSGETYEVCLTNVATVERSIDPIDTFSCLREINPTPYSALLRFSGSSVLSASPERFLRIDADRVVESKPIKGTRPRAKTEAEDDLLRKDLVRSEKDRAENLMIVDLVRNDLTKVCVPGSVHVPTLFDVETYAAVHQLVSTVRGTLRDDVSPVECVRAAFPAGSMTGAPKIRTMEIIDKLEDGPRGVYSGAIGYFSLTGTADFSVVIRTVVATDHEVSFGIGGAIVALSDPAEEVNETLVKAAAMRRCLSETAGQHGPPTGTGAR